MEKINLSSHPRIKRPFYNIAHRCNTIQDAASAIAAGANALEIDIEVCLQDTASTLSKTLLFYMYHDFDFFKYRLFPRNTMPKNAPHYFRYLAQLLAEKKIALLLFDMKQPKDLSITPTEYATCFIEMLTQQYHIDTRYCLLSVSGSDQNTVTAFYNGLGERFHGTLDVYDPTYQDNDLTHWLAFITAIKANFVGLGKNFIFMQAQLQPWLPWLNALVQKRDTECTLSTGLKKVFFWTATTSSIMRIVLDHQIDGMIVNDPKKLEVILQEAPYKTLFRLSTQEDQ